MGLKIGFVLDDSLDKADGVQQYVLTVGRWLKSRGHQVHYLVGQTERTDVPNVHSLSRNLQVHFNQNRMSTPLPANKAELRALLEREKFDVLHVQMPFSPFLAGRIIKAADKNTAVIGTFHIIPFSLVEHVATRLLGMWQRRTLKRFDAVCSVSRPAQKFARKSFHIKTSILPNPVSVSHFSGGKALKQYQDGRLNILFLGRLVARKGCLHFLQAVEQLHRQRALDGVRILIGGKGPLEATLKRFVRDNHLGTAVHFLGFIPEETKRDYLASADIAVFPSTGGESFGIVLVEAMASGTDVVLAGNNVGYSYVMEGSSNQLLNPADPAAFAKRLKHFIDDGRARRQAAAWQKTRVELFDISVVGRNLEELYNTALDGRKSS